MSADVIEINGISTELISLSGQIQTGTGGCSFSLEFVTGMHLHPRKGDKIEFSLDGLNLRKGIVDSVQYSLQGGARTCSVGVVGPQHLLAGAVVQASGGSSLQDALATAFADAGVEIGVSVLGDTEGLPPPISYQGDAAGLIEQAATVSGGAVPWLAPDATLYFVHPGALLPCPLDWIPNNIGYTLGGYGNPGGQIETEFRVSGRNEKPTPDTPDTEDYSTTTKGDGTTTEFQYDSRVTQITRVNVAGEQVSLLSASDPDAGTADAVNVTDADPPLIRFATAPADGDEVETLGVIAYTDATAVDQGMVDTLSARFGGAQLHRRTEQHPELVSQSEAETWAQGLKARYGGIKYEASAEVWARVAIFTPLHQVRIDDGHGFSATLPVSGNSVKRSAQQWIQSVSCSNSGDYGSGMGGLGQSLRRATRPKQPPAPTDTTPFRAFTLSVSPETVTVVDGATNALQLTITVPNTGFTGGTITLEHDLPAGYTGTFTPASISNHGTAKLRITPDDNEWNTGDDLTVTVTGTSGAIVRSDSAEIEVLASPPDPPLPYIDLEIVLPNGPATNGTSDPVDVTAVATGFNGATGTLADVSFRKYNNTAFSMSPETVDAVIDGAGGEATATPDDYWTENNTFGVTAVGIFDGVEYESTVTTLTVQP